MIPLFSFSYENSQNYLAHNVPKELEEAFVVEKLGDFIQLDLPFWNENAQKILLKDLVQEMPTLLTIVYYNCPSICNFHLNGLFQALESMPLQLGTDYRLVIVSMDPRERPALALSKKRNYLKEFSEISGGGRGMAFLTDFQDSVKKLAKQLGFSYRWDKDTEQFAHTPVAYILTPKGQISRYLYGIEFDSKTLKMSLLEGSQGKITSLVDRILLFCYRFNPKKNRYTLYAYNIMRLGGLLTVVLLLFFLASFAIKERNK